MRKGEKKPNSWDISKPPVELNSLFCLNSYFVNFYFDFAAQFPQPPWPYLAI
jgi:hypothetical protein